jgi:hypothetical protein
MRTCVIIALTVAGVGLLVEDASAFGKRRHHNDCGCQSGYAAPVSYGCSGCGGGYAAAPVYGAGYATGCSSCGGNVAYSTGYAQGRHGYSMMPNNGAYTAGYNGYYPGQVYPAGYGSQVMPAYGVGGPGVVTPAGNTVPTPMPGKTGKED